MIQKVFSVFDIKAACYSAPFFQHNDSVATRSFIDVVNDPKSAVYIHPEDYILREIGEFDDNTGVLKAIEPKTLVTASAVQRPKEDPRQTHMFGNGAAPAPAPARTK